MYVSLIRKSVIVSLLKRFIGEQSSIDNAKAFAFMELKRLYERLEGRPEEDAGRDRKCCLRSCPDIGILTAGDLDMPQRLLTRFDLGMSEAS